MKKFGLLVAGGIAATVLIANLGSMVGLVVSLAILYLMFKQFLKADSVWAKIGWGTIGLIALLASALNAPAILGVVAAYVLYLVYKKWNENKSASVETDDPFTNFEKQWSQLKNY